MFSQRAKHSTSITKTLPHHLTVQVHVLTIIWHSIPMSLIIDMAWVHPEHIYAQVLYVQLWQNTAHTCAHVHLSVHGRHTIHTWHSNMPCFILRRMLHRYLIWSKKNTAHSEGVGEYFTSSIKLFLLNRTIQYMHTHALTYINVHTHSNGRCTRGWMGRMVI